MYPTMKNSPFCGENLIPAPENSGDRMQNKGKSKTEEDKRIVLELLNEERDLDYYSDSESESDYEYQSYV